MRYRDDEEFWNLRYFIQRYISEATLMLEMRFIHRCFTAISGNEVEAVVIDTMGLDNRKKNILETYHGRYLLNKVGKLLREEHTLGRAIAMKEFTFEDSVNARKLI
jgi:hypothetical protein